MIERSESRTRTEDRSPVRKLNTIRRWSALALPLLVGALILALPLAANSGNTRKRAIMTEGSIRVTSTSYSGTPSGVATSFDVDGSGDVAAVQVGVASAAKIMSTIELVDLTTSKTTAQFTLSGGGNSLGALRISPDGRTIWITSPNGAVASISSANQVVNHQLTMPSGVVGPGSTTAFSALVPTAWVSNPLSGTVTKFNSTTGVIEKTYSILPPPPPGNSNDGMGLALSPDGLTLWITDLSTRRLVGIDTSTGKETRTIPISNLLNEGIAMADSMAWVVTQASGNRFEIVPINLDAGTVGAPLATFSDGLIKLPSRLVGNTLWVLDTHQGSAVPVNVMTGSSGSPVAVATPMAPPSAPPNPSPGGAALVNCDISNPNLAQAAKAFETAAGTDGEGVGIGGWCGRYQDSPTWIWVATGNEATRTPGFIATYTCAPGDSACLGMTESLPVSGWEVHPPPQPGTINVLATQAIHQVDGNPVVFIQFGFFSANQAEPTPYWFDPRTLRFEEPSTGLEISQPNTYPATDLPQHS